MSPVEPLRNVRMACRHPYADRPAADRLQGDHDLMRKLLVAFEAEPVSALRRDLLRLAIDLFDAHARLEDGAGIHDADRTALFDLIETIEITDPRSKLYFARGVEFRRRLEAHLDAEEARIASPEILAVADGDLLHLRDVLRGRADAMLHRFGGAPTALAA